MEKRIPILILVLLIAGAAVFAYRNANKPPDNRLMISGNIELNEVNIAFKTAGRLIERSVDEGDAVKKGQILARLDRDQLLAQAHTAVDLQRASLAADIETRTADLSSMEARLAELRNGARPQERLDAK